MLSNSINQSIFYTFLVLIAYRLVSATDNQSILAHSNGIDYINWKTIIDCINWLRLEKIFKKLNISQNIRSFILSNSPTPQLPNSGLEICTWLTIDRPLMSIDMLLKSIDLSKFYTIFELDYLLIYINNR